MAIIDLDGSPCRVVPASPIIVLTDSEKEKEPSAANKEPPKSHEVTMDEVIRPSFPPESSPQQEQPPFRAPAGPKTPPEPATVKFTMSTNKPRIRPPITNIFETEEASNDQQTRSEEQQQSNKVGPNTPPEPNPLSPDAYDPFEPTKSPSEHLDGPDRENGVADDEPPSRSSTPPLGETKQVLNAAAAATAAAAASANKEPETTINPVELVMSLINKSSACRT